MKSRVNKKRNYYAKLASLPQNNIELRSKFVQEFIEFNSTILQLEHFIYTKFFEVEDKFQEILLTSVTQSTKVDLSELITLREELKNLLLRYEKYYYD